jgi:hypothetical protein
MGIMSKENYSGFVGKMAFIVFILVVFRYYLRKIEFERREMG